MVKYGQNQEEQLQRFRKTLPKDSWWVDQVKTCKDLENALKILDTEFENQRKLIDELLAEIDNHSTVKGDSRSLTRYTTTITVFVRDMAHNGCSVKAASEAPFLMSKLLSKLQPRDNCDFGKEMQRERKEENISNLVDWLRRDASLWSRGRKENDGDSSTTKAGFRHKSANNFDEVVDDGTCPMNCATKHLLSACPVYHNLSVSQRWDTKKPQKMQEMPALDHITRKTVENPMARRVIIAQKTITARFTLKKQTPALPRKVLSPVSPS